MNHSLCGDRHLLWLASRAKGCPDSSEACGRPRSAAPTVLSQVVEL